MTRGGGGGGVVAAAVAAVLLAACPPASSRRCLHDAGAALEAVASSASLRRGGWALGGARALAKKEEAQEGRRDVGPPAGAAETFWWRILRRGKGGDALRAAGGAKTPRLWPRLYSPAVLGGLVGLSSAWAWGRASGLARPAGLINAFVGLDEFTALPQSWVRESKQDSPERRLYADILRVYDFVFQAADITGDGRLDAHEQQYADLLWKYATHIPVEIAALADTSDDVIPYDFAFDIADAAVQHNDNNGDGLIDYGEYFAGMKSAAEEEGWGDSFNDLDVQEWVSAVWDTADVTRDGRVNRREMHFLLLLVDSDVLHAPFDAAAP